MGKIEDANINFVSVCKKQNVVNITYFDSKGIYKIIRTENKDTLELRILVSSSANTRSTALQIIPSIRYIKYGNIVREVNKIDKCPKILSNKEGEEYLRGLLNKSN